MDNSFNTMTLYSPVPDREFIWVGEYRDGTLLSEFQEGGKASSFYDIDKERLKRFGLVGNGYSFYYNINDSEMHLAGKRISFKYITDDAIYNLSGTSCNDIIQFKRSAADFNPFGGNSGSSTGSIIGYCFGYKNKIDFNGVSFNFKPIFRIEDGLPMYINMTLSADKALDGKLVVVEDGIEKEYVAPIKAGVSGQLNYLVGGDK